MSSVDEEGAETIVQVVRQGEMFGELFFCPASALPRGMFGRAIAASRVLEACIEDDSLLFNRAVSARLAGAENRLRVLAVHDGASRLGATCEIVIPHAR